MTHLKTKLSVAAVVLACAVGYLAYAGMQKGWVYTLGVDQYLASPEHQASRVRLCGLVSDQHLEIKKSALTAKFMIKGESKSLAVLYKGVIPDMFKAGAEVIVEGKRDPATQVFTADLLMTKRASKYEENGSGEKMPPSHPPVGGSHPNTEITPTPDHGANP